MPIGFTIFCVVYGALALLFAFVPPPGLIGGLFKVPRIFIFLPDRWIVPVGRAFMGVAFLGFAGWMYLKLPH